MASKKIKAIIIEDFRQPPRPVEIDNDILALYKAVMAANIDILSRPGPDDADIVITEIQDDIHIFSCPNSLCSMIRVVDNKVFTGVMYIVRLCGYRLESLTNSEIKEYCNAFKESRVFWKDLVLLSKENKSIRAAIAAMDAELEERRKALDAGILPGRLEVSDMDW